MFFTISEEFSTKESEPHIYISCLIDSSVLLKSLLDILLLPIPSSVRFSRVTKG